MNSNYFKIEEIMTNDSELIEEQKSHTSNEISIPNNGAQISSDLNESEEEIIENLAKCPSCGEKTLKIEGGCHSCINNKCGYSKCDV